jgi:uncharacterized protein DUF4145
LDLSLWCPKCRQKVVATPATGAVVSASPISDQFAYLICRCPTKRCEPIFVVYDQVNDQVNRTFPFPETSVTDYHQAIPERVREDLGEAARCWYGRAYRMVVAACRRAMQEMAQEKGATGAHLINQIDDLRTEGLITESLQKAAHEIRYFGNFGAHPRDDGLDNITQEIAQAVRGLTSDFTVDLYVRPFETAKLTRKRTGQ